MENGNPLEGNTCSCSRDLPIAVRGLPSAIGRSRPQIMVTFPSEKCYAPGMSFKVSVSHQKVAGAELRDFPVLVQVRHDELRGARGIRLLAEDGTVLCYEVVMLDAASGELQAWVRVPRLSNRQDAVLVVEPSSKKQKPISGAIWDGFRFVAHGPTVERVAH